MITLSARQWNVLTFMQRYERTHYRLPRFSDISAGCGLSRRQTEDTVNYLSRKGLAMEIFKRINGHTVRYARRNKQAGGVIAWAVEDGIA